MIASLHSKAMTVVKGRKNKCTVGVTRFNPDGTIQIPLQSLHHVGFGFQLSVHERFPLHVSLVLQIMFVIFSRMILGGPDDPHGICFSFFDCGKKGGSVGKGNASRRAPRYFSAPFQEWERILRTNPQLLSCAPEEVPDPSQ